MKVHKVIDMFTRNMIEYPAKNPRLKYDFNFLKDGIWYYINSADKIEKLKDSGQCEEAIQGWRIIEASSGDIIEKSSLRRL